MDDRQTLRDTWPEAWLMTDPRFGERLWEILNRLPAGTGVVLRDLARGEEIARLCAQRELTLAVSRDVARAEALGAALVHNPVGSTPLPFSRSVHDEGEAERARMEGASLVFVSPVFATRSHPGAPALGADEAVRLARLAAVPAIALGGMNAERFAAIKARGFAGWAGIDAWMERLTP